MAREGGADRGSLRSAARALRGSLAMRCLALLGVYALVLAGLLGGMGALVDGLFDGAFPSMGTVLEYEGELADDRFGALATSRLSNALIVVFDADGRCLYASSERAAERVSAADLAIIGSYAGSPYEGFEEAGEDGEVRYLTAGGRVLGITALGRSLPEAVERAYAAADQVDFEGKHQRSDIGRRALAALEAGKGEG